MTPPELTGGGKDGTTSGGGGKGNETGGGAGGSGPVVGSNPAVEALDPLLSYVADEPVGEFDFDDPDELVE